MATATAPTAQRRPGPSAGFTLIEVVVCAGILAIAAVGTASAILTSAHLNIKVNYETLALAAAEDQLAQIRGTAYSTIAATFTNRTFAVPGLPSPVGTVDPGEVIIVNSETPNEAALGRNLGGAAAGAASGVDLNGDGRTNQLTGAAFGMDIDGDKLFNTAAVANMSTASLIPVVVLVRWRTGDGIHRMQVMTAIVNRYP